MLDQHHHCLLLRHSHASEWNPWPSSRFSPFPSFCTPWQQSLCILLLWIFLVWIFFINQILRYATFYVRLLSLSMTFSRFVHVAWISKYFIPSYGWIFHCETLPQFVYFIHSPIGGPLGCSHLLVIINSASLNTDVHISVWVPVFNSLGYIPRVELQGHMVIPCLIFWETVKLFHSS